MIYSTFVLNDLLSELLLLVSLRRIETHDSALCGQCRLWLCQ
jgi:hypothetical protein